MLLSDFLKECGGISSGALQKQLLDVGGVVGVLPKAPPSISKTVVAAAPGEKVTAEWYLGPAPSITPDDLDKLDKEGGWIIEPKIDGMWCKLTVGDPANGKPHRLESRNAAAGPIAPGYVDGLDVLLLPLPPGSVLVGELEAATEHATKVVANQGFRRLHLFDLPIGDDDHWQEPWVQRRARLHNAWMKFSGTAKSRMPLLPYWANNFRDRWNFWTKVGGEGAVVKRVSSIYWTDRADGKTDEWRRCKKTLTADYVLCGIGKTPGGQPTGLWGTHKDGKLVKVFRARVPEKLLDPNNVGKLVCEFMGWELLDSGALRHAQFVKVRADKHPSMCVHSAP